MFELSVLIREQGNTQMDTHNPILKTYKCCQKKKKMLFQEHEAGIEHKVRDEQAFLRRRAKRKGSLGSDAKSASLYIL